MTRTAVAVGLSVGCALSLFACTGEVGSGAPHHGADAAVGTDALGGGDSPAVDVYRTAVMTDSPAGYWRLGEASGTTATDEMGAHNGTYSGDVTLGAPGALTDHARTGAHFGGTNGYVDLGQNFDYATTTAPYSLEAWVKSDQATVHPPASIFVRNGTVNNLAVGYRFEQLGGDLEVYINTGTVSGSDTYLHTPITPNAFIHVVATYDGTSYRIYMNGALKVTTPAGSLSNSIASFSAGIGGCPSFAYFWKGTIQEVAVYSHELSAARVLAHYQAGTL